MPQPPGVRTVYFWQRQGGTSQLLRDLKKLPKPVLAYFVDRLNALAASGDSTPPPSPSSILGGSVSTSIGDRTVTTACCCAKRATTSWCLTCSKSRKTAL